MIENVAPNESRIPNENTANGSIHIIISALRAHTDKRSTIFSSIARKPATRYEKILRAADPPQPVTNPKSTKNMGNRIIFFLFLKKTEVIVPTVAEK